jgi:hypothetical protein
MSTRRRKRLGGKSRSKVVTLSTGRIRYGSPGDERALFAWLGRIGCVTDISPVDFSVVGSPNDDELRELVALFYRYRGDMGQLAQFETPKNSAWFRRPRTFWSSRVFGTRPRSVQAR